MGIDRISTRPPADLSLGKTAPSGEAAEAGFSSSLGRAEEPASKVLTAATALRQLQSGQIDYSGYLDVKVREATEHLSMLSKEQVASIREALRSRIATDPALAELARIATGRAPDVSSDD
jgi:hypothetical protein